MSKKHWWTWHIAKKKKKTIPHGSCHLGHPNTRAFLSHGGLNSIYEAMYHGVPVVGVPLFGDHYDTMTRVAAKGMGIMLHWKYMNEEDLYKALTSVINDTRLDSYSRLISVIVYQCHLVTICGITSLWLSSTYTILTICGFPMFHGYSLVCLCLVACWKVKR